MNGSESPEHRKVVEMVAKRIKGEIVIMGGNKVGRYFPDVRTKDTDIECEMYPKSRVIRIKAERWDKKRKKILYISVFDYVYEYFDKVYFINQDTGQTVEIKKTKVSSKA